MPKANEKELLIHSTIINGNDIALTHLYDLYGLELVQFLKLHYYKLHNQDQSMIFEAVNEALINYYFNPISFNPELNSLKGFLEMAAERDLQNILNKEKKYKENRKILPSDVELQENFWNSKLRSRTDPENEIIFSETLIAINELLKKYFKEERDVELAKLILENERKTEVFSKVLNVEDLDAEQQRVIVKRNKDRVKKTIERNDLENKIKQVYER